MKLRAGHSFRPRALLFLIVASALFLATSVSCLDRDGITTTATASIIPTPPQSLSTRGSPEVFPTVTVPEANSQVVVDSPSPTRTYSLDPPRTADLPTPASDNINVVIDNASNRTLPIAVALHIPDDGVILLLDVQGDLSKTIEIGNSIPGSVIWSENGCAISVTSKDPLNSSVQVHAIDLGKDISETVFSYSPQNRRAEETEPRFPTVSPDGKWVAYTVWSGELQYVGAEYQDIELASVDLSSGPFQVTERGGAWWKGGAWSPDGKNYAYTDSDESGVSQLYITNRDELEQLQLSDFGIADGRVEVVKWSDDGERLVFSRNTEERTHGTLWLVNADGSDLHSLGLENMPPLQGEAVWWVDSEQIAAQLGNGGPDDGIYWLSAKSGEVQHILSAEDAPLGRISSAFQSADDSIVRFLAGDHNIYEYDYSTGSLSSWVDRVPTPEGFPLITDVVGAPEGAVDLTNCPQ